MSKIPRRVYVEKMVPAELAIRNAMLEIEKLPPDTRLTEAIVMLDKAKNLVSDFVDDPKSR